MLSPCSSVSFVNFEQVNAGWVFSIFGKEIILMHTSISKTMSISNFYKILNINITKTFTRAKILA